MKEYPPIEICILAGGASSRMGTNKAQLRLGRQTMLARIRQEAEKTGYPVRVIRRDKVDRCGPLGGIFTALDGTWANAVLFLACDMPLVNAEFIRTVLSQFTGEPLFVQSESAGFPFVLGRDSLPVVKEQIAARELSLHRLCARLNGKLVQPTPAEVALLFNVNTPEDMNRVRQTLDSIRREP